ncbi:MAG: hypothetical protein JXB30_08420 [Anaerolineae bacterium]|nr:hypothetical protein [Anaerolineae bacterium]
MWPILRFAITVLRMMKSETIPVWLWRLVPAVLLGAVIAVLILLVMALGGISNPQRIGELVVHDDLARDIGWVLQSGEAQGEIDDGVYQVALSGDKARAFVLAPYQVQAPCTIMIAVRQIGGLSDAGYGLWWGDLSAERYNVVAVNGNGYLTVFQSDAGKVVSVMPWQVFPRIHPQGVINTMQVDVIDDHVLVRVNDEVAATLDWVPERSFGTGFYVETFAAGGTIACLDWLSIWQEAGG